MDPLSQGALGASTSQSVASRKHIVLAGILGWIGGMAPDLDVLIRSPEDPLLFLEYHRQFTHSLVFIPVGAFICALVLYPVTRRHLSLRESWLWCLLGYATHGLLDACTSYGTQLFWPFTNARIAWNNVSVIDPLFTLPLLLGVIVAFVRRSPRAARFGIGWAIAYLALGLLQTHRAQQAGEHIAASRGHAPVAVSAKPSFANLLVWKTVYAYDGYFHVDAVRTGARVRWMAGDRLPTLDVDRDLPWLDPASQQARDIERFRWFSADFIALDPVRPDTVVDIRYSMLPQEIDALWGIGLDRNADPAAHVRYEVWRDGARERGPALLDMINDREFGSPLPTP
ncbi:MAG: metal-dependent hydrolase [Pseudomonadota bacterium]